MAQTAPGPSGIPTGSYRLPILSMNPIVDLDLNVRTFNFVDPPGHASSTATSKKSLDTVKRAWRIKIKHFKYSADILQV
jgi:hypothetical protein